MSFLQVQPRLAIETDFVERLLATSHSIVMCVDPTARIVLFNDSMRDLCGRNYRDVVGEDWFNTFVPQPERDVLRQQFAMWQDVDIEDTHVRPVLCPIMNRGGDVRQVEWEVNAVRGPDGELLGLLGIGQDVTEKLALRAKLAESERLANIGLMASVLAHEIGNPLNAMYLQIQMLRRVVDRPSRGPLTPKVDAILSEITRLNMVLDDFRAYRDPAKILLTPTDVTAVITHVTELLTVRAAEHDVSVTREIEPELPLVMGNGNKLKQVLFNLCKNAIEAMSDGGKLVVAARCEPEWVCVEVIDDGPGLPTEIDVFAPFATTKPTGMGLGLPLAREIVMTHGGELTFTTAPGAGTTFKITLPKC
jgi:PAS domain S-box-containing protein